MSLGKTFHFLLWIAYPAIIFFGLRWLEPRAIAGIIGLLLILRWRKEAKFLLSGLPRSSIVVFCIFLAITVVIAITNNETLLRLYPAAVNIGMLLIFFGSLIYPPSMIEKFARLQTPNLPAAGIRYTRRVTQIWCAFFILNGAIAIYTAFFTSREIWSLYNGLIAYLLMGVLFVGEWIIRHYYVKPDTKA